MNKDKSPTLETIVYAWARTEEERSSSRITQENIAALKEADYRSRTAGFTMAAVFGALIRDVISCVGGLFHQTVKRHPMCENYGHIADVRTWTDHLPNCSDCGKKITSRAQLRKPVPHS
jgi:hypothetical protein